MPSGYRTVWLFCGFEDLMLLGRSLCMVSVFGDFCRLTVIFVGPA